MSKKRASARTKTDRTLKKGASRTVADASGASVVGGCADADADQSGALPAWLSRANDGSWVVRVKAVPGASRDQIAGVLGDRLKVRVSAPPEGGKANKAICKLIAKNLGVAPRLVVVTSGASSAAKTVVIEDPTMPAHSVQQLAN